MTVRLSAPTTARTVGGTARAATASWLRAAAVALPLLLGIAAKAPEIVLPLGPDQGTYSYVAERLLAGGQPYVDAFDNKPPGTYVAHAAVLALVPAGARWQRSCLPGGLFQPCGYLALQVVDVLGTAATVLLLFAVARRLAESDRVAVAAASVAAVFLNLSQLSKEGSTPEKQLLLPMVLAYLATLRWLDGRRPGWLILAGVGAGVAFLFKQTAVSIPLALAAWALWTTGGGDRRAAVLRARGAALLFAGGAALPIAVACAYLAARGALGAFWEAAFVYNVGQAGSSVGAIPYAFLRGAWQVFNESSALLWLLACGGGLRLLGERSPRTRLALCWAVADLASLFLGGTKFAQVSFVQLVPSFAILAALALETAWAATRGAPLARLFVALTLATVFALSTSLQVHVALRAWNDRLPGRAVPPAEEVVAQRLVPLSGPLYVWGDASQLYLLTGEGSPSRFFQVYPLSQFFTRGTGYLARRAELVRALEGEPPAAIAIDPATARDDPDGTRALAIRTFPELESLLASDYRPLDGLPGGWRAYVHR